MQKKLFLTAIILLLVSFAGTVKAFEPPRMHPTDRFMVTLFTDVWQDTPDGMDLKTIQRGVSIEAMQDMPLGRSNFSVAAGLGFTSHNLYSDHRYLYNLQEDIHDFYPIQLDYDKNKISLNYIDVPVQFRFRSRDLERTFRLYAGVRAGYLVNAHTKYEGKAYFAEPGGIQFSPEAPHDMYAVPRTTKIKEHKLENINDFRIGLTAMVGYGRINVHFPIRLPTFLKTTAQKKCARYPWGLLSFSFNQTPNPRIASLPAPR